MRVPPRSLGCPSVPVLSSSDPLHADVDLPLFRREALDARTSQWMGKITLSQPVSSWLLPILVFLFAVTLLIFLFIGTYTRHESVHGQLIPSTGLLPVTTRSAGTVLATLVGEGQAVTKGQVLVELSGEVNSLSRGQTQSAVILDLQAQLKELEALLDNQKSLEDQQHLGLTAR